ncbi:peptidylprolyl isomerase [Acetivibrio ethanolgignens]|uniref:PpiC domain-containing protein n=1 Tax=Acetivibrio ethanolgignens TaxID=290052 RepID=A0A0V8QCT3_9FIRM|nr:peptidylprolyl isomerase [Acetivibrio ethanolgignens]KSV57865.1 hypothetical protein ASU35_03895 [Acetivibrio ethanolgignens]
MKRNRWIIIGLVFCLLLTGCGRKKAGEEGAKEISKDAVMMAVGEDNVSAQEAMAYLYLLKQQYEAGMGEEVWSYQLSEDKTLEDYAREAVISNLTQLKIMCQQAAKEGIELDEEESYEAKKAAQQIIKTAGKADRERFRLEEEVLTRIYADNTLAAKLFDVTTGQVDTNITDEEARQITVQYLLVSTGDMDKAQKEVAREQAEKLLKEAKKASSFLNFATTNSDSEEIELTFGREHLPEGFGQEAMELRTGEFSPVIEGEKGYYIVYCIADFDEDATTNRKEVIIEERRDKLFREKYKEWSENYKVVISTALWDELLFTPKNALSKQN